MKGRADVSTWPPRGKPPRGGITVDLLPQLALPGGGHWVEQPHRAVAFGALYFAFTAWSKWRDWMVGAPTR